MSAQCPHNVRAMSAIPPPKTTDLHAPGRARIVLAKIKIFDQSHPQLDPLKLSHPLALALYFSRFSSLAAALAISICRSLVA